MKIHTKALTCDGTRIGSVDALFAYAKEVLGDHWIFTHSTSGSESKLVFRDPTGSGDQGWTWVNNSTSPSLISDGVSTQTSAKPDGASIAKEIFTGMVWEGDSGSVGIGWVSTQGLYATWYLLAKFDGSFLDKDVYCVSIAGSNRPPIMVRGTTDIGNCNLYMDDPIGNGVYLHPLLDPVSGLTSSDVFGVRSVDSKEYITNGMVVKQGSTSYMSVIPYWTDGVTMDGMVFAKM